MVDRIGSNSDSLQQAWQAARARRASPTNDLLQSAKALQDEARAMQGGSPPAIADPAQQQGSNAGGVPTQSSFGSTLASNVRDVTQKLRAVDELPKDLLAGKVDSLPEMAAQIKTADLSFRFALEVRNKLIDAYREIMRMSV